MHEEQTLISADYLKHTLYSATVTKDASTVISLIKQMDCTNDKNSSEALLKSLYISLHGRPGYKGLVKALYLEFMSHGLNSPQSSQCYNNHRHTAAKTISEQESPNRQPLAELKPLDVCTHELKFVGSIPHIIHNIWTTSISFDDRKKIDSFNRNNKYMKNNVALTPAWQHNFWFLSEDFVSTEILNKVRLEGFNIHFATELATNPVKIFLVNSAMVFASLNNFLIACDITKYLVLAKYGGLYIDGDYKLYKSPDALIDSFNSIFPNNYSGNDNPFIETHFLAAFPNHSIFLDAILKVHRNLQMTTSPSYTKFPCDFGNKVINLADSSVLKFSLDVEIDNSDAIMPKGVLSTKDKKHNPYSVCPLSDMAINIGIIGNDDALLSWTHHETYDYT